MSLIPILGLELSAAEILSRRTALPPRHRFIAANFWYLSAAEPAELWERQAMLKERALKLKARACVVTLTAGFLARETAGSRVSALLRDWEGVKACPLYFDVGQNETPRWLPPEIRVEDPLWFSRRPAGRYWRIHGWHRERWVRKYSDAELARLGKMILRHKPGHVALAHSQRVEQLIRLQSILHAT